MILNTESVVKQLRLDLPHTIVKNSRPSYLKNNFTNTNTIQDQVVFTM